MKIKSFVLLSLLIANSAIAQKSDIKYDFSCYNTDPFTAMNSIGNDFEEAMLNGTGAESSVSEEEELGKKNFEENKTDYKFIFSILFLLFCYLSHKLSYLV